MKNHNKAEIKKILSNLVFCDKRFFILIAVYGVFIALLNLALPLSIQVLVSSVIYTALIQPVVIVGIILLFLLSFSAILTILQKFLIEIYKRNSFVRISSNILLKAIYSDSNSFRSHHTSDLSGRYFEIFNLQNNASELIVEGLLVLLSIAVSFILSSFYHPYFLILNLIILVVIWISWGAFTKQAIERAIHRSESKFAVFAWIDDIFKMNIFFKAGQNKDFALAKGFRLIKEYIESRKKYWNISFSQLIILSILYVFITIALLTLGSVLIIKGQLSLGQLMAAEILYTTSLYGISKLSIYYDKYYNLIASADELNHVFIIEDEHIGQITNLDVGSKPHLDNEKIIITFNQVEYADLFNVKHYFDFTIEQHSRNLIATKHQSTKSILLNLLLNMLSPDKGYIEFRRTHIPNIDQHYLRNQIQLIDNANMIGCSIGEFLEFSLSDVMFNQINDILEVVGLNKLIHNLPNSFNTVLLGNGYPLQEAHIILLKIAKAILSTPKVIIITEIFDKVDKQIQRQILDYIIKYTQITLICFFDSETNLDHYDNFIFLTKEKTYSTRSSHDFQTLVQRIEKMGDING